MGEFSKKDNVIVTSVASPSARRYIELSHVYDLTTYGNNIVTFVFIVLLVLYLVHRALAMKRSRAFRQSQRRLF